MLASEEIIQMYEDLASWEAQEGSPQLRDRFLLLAADAALAADRLDLAQHFHIQLVEANPTHLVKAFATVEDALQAPQVSSYLDHLRIQYPPATAAQMLGRDAAVLHSPVEGPWPEVEAISERYARPFEGASSDATSAIFSTRCVPRPQ